jgi:hypothetical protein
MNSQIELYAADHNGVYPDKLTTITGNTSYFPDGAPVCPKGGSYTLETNNRVTCSHKD